MSESSSLPPLPPGVPLRPGSDSYRPLPPPPSGQYPRKRSPEQFDMYTFHGNGYSSRDVARQHVQRRPRSPPRSPLSAESSGRQKYGGDSYRPATNGFTFSMEPPPSIDLSRASDTYRPPPPRSGEHRNDGTNGRSRTQDRGHRPNRGRGSARGRGTWSSKAADRPFLLSTRASTPELMPGMEEADRPKVKYRALEDLSDSDEADMDVSSDDENERKDVDSEEQHKKKQSRTDLNQSADGNSVPKWSNPDPYTVLPPPDESQRKKMDVVKLIRKARVVSSSELVTKTEAVTDDFISFDFNEESKDDLYQSQSSIEDESGNGVPGAPKGPRSHRHPEIIRNTRISNLMGSKLSVRELDTSSDPALGSRKRNFEDEIKDRPLLPLKRTSMKLADGSVVRAWQAIAGVSDTPWCTVEYAATENVGFW
jgi:non-canonical poly(A) RNA polymerase PAPD5/7